MTEERKEAKERYRVRVPMMLNFAHNMLDSFEDVFSDFSDAATFDRNYTEKVNASARMEAESRKIKDLRRMKEPKGLKKVAGNSIRNFSEGIEEMNRAGRYGDFEL